MNNKSKRITLALAIAVAITIGWNFFWKTKKIDGLRQIHEALRDYEATNSANAQVASTCSGMWKIQRGEQVSCLVIKEANSIISGYYFTDPFVEGFSAAITGYTKGASIEIQFTALFEHSGVYDNEYRQVIMEMQHNIRASQEADIIRGQDIVISTDYVNMGGSTAKNGPETTTLLFAAQRINQFPSSLLSNSDVMEILKQHDLFDVINH